MRLYRNIKILSIILFIVVFSAIVLIMDDSSPDSITGDVVHTSVEVKPVQNKSCSFELYPGWNMVSFYCLGLFTPRNTVLASVESSYSYIFEYNADDLNDHWKSYNPTLPSWAVQQLTNMDRLSGYWIYMRSNSTFFYNGIYSSTALRLYEGWNFIGYPQTKSFNISMILENVSFSEVKYYYKTTANMTFFDNNTNSSINITYYSGPDIWLIHINGASGNTLENLDPFRGYWINVSENITLDLGG